MRLWSIHPQYLDRIGLIACWREALLAKKVLQRKTKGYTKHPQLIRFRNYQKPILAINTYLYYLWQEARTREYHFDQNKVGRCDLTICLPVTSGQITYEWKHFLYKLKRRKVLSYRRLVKIKKPLNHPLFETFEGEIESWEKRQLSSLPGSSRENPALPARFAARQAGRRS